MICSLRISRLTFAVWLVLQTSLAAATPEAQLDSALAAIHAVADRSAAELATLDTEALADQATLADRAAAEITRPQPVTSADDTLSRLLEVLDAKSQVDLALQRLLERRTQFDSIEPPEVQLDAARQFLKACQILIDLSGRLRYTLRDAIDGAAFDLQAEPLPIQRLLELLADQKSEIGALVMTPLLFAPAADENDRLLPHVDSHRARVLRLIAATGCVDALPSVARFLHERASSPELMLLAAQTIRQIGLPQDPRPGQDDTLPAPEITARQLHAIVTKIDPARLSPQDAEERTELLAWLDRRMREGVTDDSYRIGSYEVRPGDWLLMRNPSPYNRFTNLSPGLFTHVGVVAAETGTDGIRRIVVVDLPERGSHMPATNVETFLQRTLHYAFLRHDDPRCGRTMGRVATSVIGNETQFDLNFRTDRVRELKGQPLAGQPIHTYCAGLLLLCAQETSASRDEIFPLPETVAPGRTADNLQKLGLSVGDDFVSPTGAIFSSHMQIVGRRAPMYEPTRDIEEAVFDHFALSLETKELFPSNTWYQSMRLRLAQAAQVTPLLGRVLARANDISPETDLVAAARAAAVVETLDEIAYGSSGSFLDARDALQSGSLAELRELGVPRDDLDRVIELRRRHADLYERWQRGDISPRELRIELVDYYSRQGRGELDARFFRGGE